MNKIIIAGLAGFAIPAGMALASTHKTLHTAANAAVGKTIVVDAAGRTVYELKGETSHRLRCKKSNGCFAIWPPVTVRSAKSKPTATRGVRGRLGVLHRNGIFQVTLAGHPLYRFAGERKGAAGGNGLTSFGGTWHVVSASGGTSTTPTTTYPSGY